MVEMKRYAMGLTFMISRATRNTNQHVTMTATDNNIIKKLRSALKSDNRDRIKKCIKKLGANSTAAQTMLEACYYLLKEGKGEQEQALKLLKRGFALKPEYAEKAQSLVFELKLRSNEQLAFDILQLGLAHAPDSLLLNNELGLLYSEHEKFEEAEKVYLGTLEKLGGRFEILVNLSDLYLKMNRFHDGIACSQLTIECNPESELGYFNLGAILQMSGNFAESVKYFEKAYQLSPGNPEVLLNLGLLYLKAGRFKEGWACLEKRWQTTKYATDMNIPLPLWRGEPLEGKGILVWSEQGLGDHIMYAGLFQKIIDRGGRLSLISSDRLKNLFCNSFPIVNYFEYKEDNKQLDISGNFTYQMPMGSLGVHLIHSFDDFGDGSAYLKADPQLIEYYSQQLRERFAGKKLIGFTWRGGLSHTRKYARDTGLEIWQPIIAHPDYQLINLQYGATEEEKQTIANMGGFNPELDCMNDIDGLAAMLCALDLLVSADNSTVHLAGALGVPVWNIVPFSSDWRWFFEEEKSYWYASMRLFHQQKLNEWKGCFDNIYQALQIHPT